MKADKLTVIWETSSLITQYWCFNSDYCIVDTKERGRILITHTGKSGKFRLGIEAIKQIFKDHNCDCLITCHPAMHYKIHPKLAKQLNVLYPDCMKSTYNEWDLDKMTLEITDYYNG